jgi:FMN phosphatase YigB (HAD superfamily)
MQIRLAQEMPLFMCANQERVVYHPYVFSASCAKMPIGVDRASGQFYKDAKKHFESLWGQRWVLFDLGNVLMSFDHHRVSRRLAECLNSRDSAALEEQLFNFIFSKSEYSPSRNPVLDRGDQELIWLYEELRKQFNLPLAYADFEEIWQLIFDPPTSATRQCFDEVQKSGVKIGICSNTNASHWQKACLVWPELKGPAIARFLSFEQNSVKTDPGFFEKIVQQTGRPGREHLMIDDLDENINAAAAAGLHMLRCASPLKTSEVMQILNANYFPDLRARFGSSEVNAAGVTVMVARTHPSGWGSARGGIAWRKRAHRLEQLSMKILDNSGPKDLHFQIRLSVIDSRPLKLAGASLRRRSDHVSIAIACFSGCLASLHVTSSPGSGQRQNLA